MVQSARPYLREIPNMTEDSRLLRESSRQMAVRELMSL